MGEVIDKAIIISGLNKVIKGISWLIKPMILLSMPLTKLRCFAKIQSKELSLPDSMFEDYYKDSQLLSTLTLINILSENTSFEFTSNSKIDSMVIVGDKEKSIMKKSAQRTASVLGHEVYFSFDDAAHGIPYEKAEVLNKLITSFLEGNHMTLDIDGVRSFKL